MGDVMTQVRRQVPVTAGVAFQMAGARNFARGPFDAGTVQGAETAYANFQRVQTGDLIFPKLGAWEGAFAFVPDELDGRHVSPEYCVFEVTSPEAHVDYLAHLFAWDSFWRAIGGRATGTNVRRRRLQPGGFLEAELLLPSPAEQRRIATHLDRLAMVSSVGEWVSPRQALTSELLADLPGRPIGDIAQRAADAVTVSPSQTYRTVGLMNRGRGCFARPEFDGDDTKYKTLYTIRAGQLIYSKLFAWEGSVSVVPEGLDGFTVSSEFPTYDLDLELADPAYIGHLTRWEGMTAALASETTGMGQRRQRVMPQQFEAVVLPIPSLDQQRLIARILDIVSRLEDRAARRHDLAGALLPAARNEIFSTMR